MNAFDFKKLDWIYGEYYVDSRGAVYDCAGNDATRINENRDRAYPRVYLNDRWYNVHQLVCHAFHGPRPPHRMACHENDIKTDNRAENLYWGTAQDNLRDMHRNKKDRDIRTLVEAFNSEGLTREERNKAGEIAICLLESQLTELSRPTR